MQYKNRGYVAGSAQQDSPNGSLGPYIVAGLACLIGYLVTDYQMDKSAYQPISDDFESITGVAYPSDPNFPKIKEILDSDAVSNSQAGQLLITHLEREDWQQLLIDSKNTDKRSLSYIRLILAISKQPKSAQIDLMTHLLDLSYLDNTNRSILNFLIEQLGEKIPRRSCFTIIIFQSR